MTKNKSSKSALSIALTLIMGLGIFSAMPLSAHAADFTWNNAITSPAYASTLYPGLSQGDTITIATGAEGKLILDVENVILTTSGSGLDDISIQTDQGVDSVTLMNFDVMSERSSPAYDEIIGINGASSAPFYMYLRGTNRVGFPAGYGDSAYALFSDRELVIQGNNRTSDTLECRGGEGMSAPPGSGGYAIAGNEFTINDCTVNVRGGEGPFGAGGGIRANGDVVLNNADVTAIGAAAQSGSNGGIGISAEFELEVRGHSNLTVTGGASAGGGDGGFGIKARRLLIDSGASVTATGGTGEVAIVPTIIEIRFDANTLPLQYSVIEMQHGAGSSDPAYDFTKVPGWSSENFFLNGVAVMPNSDAWSYAIGSAKTTISLEPTTYTVTFNLNGGTHTGGGALTQTVVRGDTATAPIVTRSGYTFTGWSAAFDNVTSNLAINAGWQQNITPPKATKGFDNFTGAGTSSATVDTDLPEFIELTLDGNVVATTNYDLVQGSTIITLHENYLNTFSNGTYTFVAHFTSGTVNLPITIALPGAPAPAGTTSGNPKTADDTPLGLLITLIAVAGAALIARRRFAKN